MTNHTDKELLELAAKAAGITVIDHEYDDSVGFTYSLSECQKPIDSFNPLHDDGDALRLAVKMQFDVIPKWGDRCVCIIGGGDHFEEPQQPDIYAAMRRAIVRAAAAIGEKL